MAAKKPAKRRPGKRDKAPVDAGPPELWEQQEGEGVQAFQAFAAYRDLGEERTVRKVARIRNKAGSQIGEWSTKHRWVERARAWDINLDRIRQRELEVKQLEAAERHALMIAGSLQATAAITQRFLEKLGTEEGLQALEALSAEDLATLAIQAARVQPRLVPAERLSLGLSTTNVGGHAGGSVKVEGSTEDDRAAAKSDDELRGFLLGADAGAQAARDAREKDAPAA